MTREEKQKAINALKISAPIMAVTQEEFTGYIQTLNKIMDWLEQESSGDLISRQVVLKQLRGCLTGGETEYQYVKLHIDSIPSVKQEQKTGHWIEKAEDYYKAINEYGGGVNENTDYLVDDIACPKCLSKFSTIDNETERFNFCPNCGAKMVEPQETETWNGYHGQITAPKGTFERIFNDADDDSDI